MTVGELTGGGDDLVGLQLAEGDALFLDFDGTLAELGPDPDAIHLPEATAAALDRLAARLNGALALLSGRDIRDLASRTPAGLWRLGGHGLETIAPFAAVPPSPPSLPEAALAPLRAATAMDGVRLELKGPVAALHYRAAPDAAAACIEAAEAAAGSGTDLVAQAGKMVVEVKPSSAHKGTALRHLMQAPPFRGRRPVMLGDDTTDEDAIAAAQALGGVGVKVGPGPSTARLRTTSPASVRAWLARAAEQPE
jgi:trehalose 6-phosphate phosphatase